MGRPRNVKLSLVTLPLSDGDTITIKDRLTAGEERDITANSIRGYTSTGQGQTRIEPDPQKLSFCTAATYIHSWSLTSEDGDGKVLPIFWPSHGSLDERIKVIRALDADTLSEIDTAIEGHRRAQQEAKQGKNASGEGTGITVPSPSAA